MAAQANGSATSNASSQITGTSLGHSLGHSPGHHRGHLDRLLHLVAVGKGTQPVNVDVAVGAEDHQHDSEGQPDLGGGYHDDEQGEGLPAVERVPKVCVEGDQVDVDGVEHQLDAHQDEDGVAAHQHRVHPDREQQAGHQKRPPQRHQRPSRAPVSRPRESTIAPTSADRSRTLSTSNGSTQLSKMVRPVVSADPTTALSRSRWTPANPATTVVPSRTATSRATSAAGTTRPTFIPSCGPVGALVSMSANSRSTTTAPT